MLGSAALDICHVACGRADGYYETPLYVWDVAAASLIVQQAGGCVETLDEDERGRLSFACSNSRIHQAFMEIVRNRISSRSSA